MNTLSNRPGRIANRSMPPGKIIPELVYADLDAAVTWLCKVFGFQERLRIGNHRSQLVLGEASVIAVSQTSPTLHSNGAQPQPCGVTHSLLVVVEDVDRHYEHFKQQVGQVLAREFYIHPPETYPFGERQYTVEDPGGHLWTFTQSVADVAPEQWGGKSIASR
jgi:uncharacterized glyoxalase superfamily protein PhnB